MARPSVKGAGRGVNRVMLAASTLVRATRMNQAWIGGRGAELTYHIRREFYFGAPGAACAVIGSNPRNSFAASTLVRNCRIWVSGTTKVEPGTGNFNA